MGEVSTIGLDILRSQYFRCTALMALARCVNCHLLVRGCCSSCLLMNGKLLFLQFSYSCSDVFLAC